MNESTTILEFREVSVDFGGGPVLDKVTFHICQGESKVLFGAAGSGKTVLLKTALGLVEPSGGHVLLFGKDVNEISDEERLQLRAKIGMLFQESALFDSLTVRENVAYPLENQPGRALMEPDAIEEKVKEALRFVELEQTLDKFPSELSGGMRRRVGIARANVTEPPLMLYDSPTAGLDPITANTIMALLIKNRDTRQTSSMVVSHRLQDGDLLVRYRWDAEKASLVADSSCEGAAKTAFLVLHAGQLVFDGSESMLRASRDPYVMRFVRKTA